MESQGLYGLGARKEGGLGHKSGRGVNGLALNRKRDAARVADPMRAPARGIS
jgi:hypothetical protein